MIGPAVGPEIIAGLTDLNASLSGIPIGTAYDDLITGQYQTDNGPPIGYADYTDNKPAITGNTNNTVTDSSESQAVDAWHDYVENEVTVVSDVTGGIVSGSDTHTFVYSLMEENPGTASAVVKAVAPVAIPVTAAVVAISQALGVSMNISEVSQEVKDTLTNAVKNTAGVIYDAAADTVTAWKDALGRILFPKRAVEAVEDALEEENIPVGGQTDYTASSNLNTSPWPNPVSLYSDLTIGSHAYTTTAPNPAWTVGHVNGSAHDMRWICASAGMGIVYKDGDHDATVNNTYTYQNKIVYYASNTQWVQTPSGPLVSSSNLGPTAWTMIYGTISGGGDYPEGTEASEAPSYTSSTIPTAGNVATSYDETTGDLGFEEVVPIQLTEDPYDSTGSTDDPVDPTDEDNPGVMTPPIPLPIPDTNVTNPDVPLVNPTVVDQALINELVDELATTLDPQAPQSSGLIPIPLMPGIPDGQGGSSYPSIVPASGSGLIHVYNPTPAEMVSFGNWLWVTYADATIDKIWNNPFDGIIGAHELYSTPQTDGTDNIRSGFLVCPTTAALVRQRYTEIDCGTVIVPEFYGNYLDYSPYSQCYIYLPFVGINEVSIDDIVGHAVNIRYRIDAYNGSCIAMIFVAKNGYQNLCYQFAGNCAVEVPLAGGSQAAIKAGVMQAEAYARSAMIQAGANLFGGVGSALMGNLGGVLSSIGGIANAYGNAQAGVEAARVANKSSVQHSGQFGASHGAMGQKIPFIIIRNPIQVKVVNYNEEYGFPAHKRVIVGGCHGYLRVKEVNVISAHATNEEKMAIELALKNGVYVS